LNNTDPSSGCDGNSGFRSTTPRLAHHHRHSFSRRISQGPSVEIGGRTVRAFAREAGPAPAYVSIVVGTASREGLVRNDGRRLRGAADV